MLHHKFEAGREYAMRKYGRKIPGGVIKCLATPATGKAQFEGERAKKLYASSSGIVDGVMSASSELFITRGDIDVYARDLIK